MNGSRFESLSNEVLLEIFEYLDGYSLCPAFYGLNQRLNLLLQSCRMRLVFSALRTDRNIWDQVLSVINPAQIRALIKCDSSPIDERFIMLNNMNLNSLILTAISRITLQQILNSLSGSNSLKHCAITPDYSFYNTAEEIFIDLMLITNADRFSRLVSWSLDCIFYQRPAYFPKVSVIFPQLRRLSIQNCFGSIDFFRFLETNTPNLKSLQFITLGISQELVPGQFSLKHIRELQFNDTNDRDELIKVLSMFPCLNKLHVECETDYQGFAINNGTYWQPILETYLTNLRHFTLGFSSPGAEPGIVDTFYQGEFWPQKRVKVRTAIAKAQYRSPRVQTIYFGNLWHFPSIVADTSFVG